LTGIVLFSTLAGDITLLSTRNPFPTVPVNCYGKDCVSTP